jgi:hypothetical protein
MFKHMKSMEKQAGNALFLVLIGVALFAGLSYVVAQNSGNSAGTIAKENNTLLASQILEYSKQLETGVNIILQNGYSESQISFAHGDLVGYGAYGDSPNTEVFNPSGGGASYKTYPKATADDWLFTGGNVVYKQGSFETIWANTTTADVDLVAVLPNIPLDLCVDLNKKAGAFLPLGTPVLDNNGYDPAKFIGTFVRLQGIGTANGYRTGCIESGGPTPVAGTYHFYHVLLAR